MIRRIAGACVLLLLLGATASWAETDYVCLKLCIANAGSYTSCTPQCTYFTPEPSLDSTPESLSRHNAFQPLKPYDDSHVLPPPRRKEQTATAEMDYSCLKLCLREGMQYQLCSGRCLKTENTQSTADINYSCLNLCLKDGSQYPACRERCVIKEDIHAPGRYFSK